MGLICSHFLDDDYNDCHHHHNSHNSCPPNTAAPNCSEYCCGEECGCNNLLNPNCEGRTNRTNRTNHTDLEYPPKYQYPPSIPSSVQIVRPQRPPPFNPELNNN